ncbi:MAG: SusC/RagA family TonB-linked outer membrane protein [Niabella sp.]
MKINRRFYLKNTAHRFIKYLLLMKLTVLFVFLASFQCLAHHSIGQERINLDLKDVSIETVLKQIAEKSKYNFVYKSEALPGTLKVNIYAKEASIDYVMEKVLQNTNLAYRKTAASLITIIERGEGVTYPPSWVLNGTVLNEKKEPVIGASITIVGTSKTTSTNGQGKFIIEVESAQDSLMITYVGYKPLVIAAGTEKEIVIQMEPDVESQKMNEVVVVGFGQQKKQSVVSAVTTVQGEQLRMPTRSLSNNLAGQVPGLIAVQRSGEPGYDNAEFWIRGTSSFAGGTSPLVLVDGVPRSMNDIEPDEIETFTLLKDAAATAVYGAEGANGVILITSKRGRPQKTKISYRGEYSNLRPTRLPEFLGSVDYLALYDEALRNEGKTPIYEDIIPYYAAGQDQDLYPDVNWLDLLRKTTNNTRHTLNFRGGGEKARFFVSGAYFGESGIFKSNPLADYNNNIGLKRYNLRSNIDLDVTTTTLLRIDLSGQYLETNYPGVGTPTLFQSMTQTPPYLFPMVYSDGSNAGHPRFSNQRVNPYNLLMESGYAKEWRNFIQSRVDLEQKLSFITEGLMIKGSISYDGNSIYNSSRTKTPEQYTVTGRDIAGNLVKSRLINEVKMGEPSESNSGDKRIYMETSLNYSRRFTNKHNVGGLLLYYQKAQQEHNQALAYKKQGYVGRGTYMYDNRYSIEANFGFTGSETFAPGHRFGFFPAVGVAWIASNEHFYPEALKGVVNSLKFRVSVGRTGNDNTGGSRFLYRSSYSTSTGYPFGIGGSGSLNSIGGMVEGRFAAPNLAWEIEDKRNYGIDVSLFKGKIDLTADYFDNLRSNILLQRRTVSAAAGFRQSPWQNFGKVSNKGIDASLNVRQNFSESLKMSLRGNITYARNKILEYDEVPQLYPWMNITGNRLNMYNLFVAERLYTNDDFLITTNGDGSKSYTLRDGYATSSMSSELRPGDIMYKDLNGDGIINQFDQTRYEGNPSVPELIWGAGINIDYKGFYASAFFQGAGKTSTVLGGDFNQGFFPFYYGIDESSARKEVLNRWTEANPSQDVLYPRLRTGTYTHNATPSTWWLRDAGFIRLKNVEAGYQFKADQLNKIGFTAARIYIMGQNVTVWDKIKMWDPETGNRNAGMQYPIPSIWTIGLELTL